MSAKLDKKENKRWKKLLDELKPKQRLFVEHYCENGGNATQAVKDAGYKAKNENVCATIGKENIRKPQIKAAIDVHKAYLSRKTEKIVMYSREKAIEEYNRAMKLAEEYGQAGAMCTAIAGKVALCGLDYKPAENPADSQPMTREEVEERLRELNELEKEANLIQLKVNRRLG